ncbi:MAG: sugar kinase [Actinomycetota bacterium]|nr:sugar kinase [Actinomycetota bacterium]
MSDDRLVEAAPHVICLGDVMVDVVARLSGPLETGSDRPAQTELRGGGSAANTACWLAYLGVMTSLLGRIGADVLGTWSSDQLGPELASGVTTDATHATGTCIVLVAPDGERTMAPDPGANAALRPEHLGASEFAAGRHLHVSGYALFSGARPAALHALSLARAAEMTVSVGAASSAPLAALGAGAFFELIGADLLLFANREEARILTGQREPRAAAEQLSNRVGRAVVTDGASGATWSQHGMLIEVPATQTEVADSTGAGDAFAAAVLGQHLRGADPADALRAGHVAGAEACRRVGARPPRR